MKKSSFRRNVPCVHICWITAKRQTRCSEACPTGALKFGDLDDANSEISRFLAENKDMIEEFRPEFEAKTRVKYLGLPKIFIVGEVLLEDNQNECVKGAKVTLKAVDGNSVSEAMTDFLGDFEFKGLEINKEYVLKAEYNGYAPAEISIRTNASKNLGEIILQKK